MRRYATAIEVVQMKLTAAGYTVVSTALLAILCTVPSAEAQGARSDFDLVCDGSGEKLESDTYYDWDRKHHELEARPSIRSAQVNGTAQIEIHEGEGRIRLPRSLLPPLTTGGDGGGWFPIRDLVVSADRIEGSVKLNGFNKPSVLVDRRTGRLRINGSESFDATCTAFNPGSTKF